MFHLRSVFAGLLLVTLTEHSAHGNLVDVAVEVDGSSFPVFVGDASGIHRRKAAQVSSHEHRILVDSKSMFLDGQWELGGQPVIKHIRNDLETIITFGVRHKSSYRQHLVLDPLFGVCRVSLG